MHQVDNKIHNKVNIMPDFRPGWFLNILVGLGFRHNQIQLINIANYSCHSVAPASLWVGMRGRTSVWLLSGRILIF